MGAVVADEDGTVLARGRSRRGETSAPANQLSGSRVAHAEVNALAGLSVDQHAGLTLYTTLEPCFLCSAAVAIAHVPIVHFAGQDPMWRFVRQFPEIEPRLAARWYELRGPLPGKLGAWATLLPLLERLGRDPRGPRVDEFDRVLPEMTALARKVVADGHAEDLRRLDLDAAMDTVWELLPAAPAVPAD